MIADRYEPTGASAWGGMGEVYKCLDHHLNRDVMLKRMQQAEEIPRLLDEQKALSKIRSKHVVQLLDIVTFVNMFGQTETSLVLEYIHGRDLSPKEFTANGSYLNVLWQIASGLAEIHRHEIIHRDIKPQNIRMDDDGVVKILDFGLARETGVDDKTKSIIGTVGYMAPELWGTDTIALSPAVDVYAFAATALALLENGLPNELLQNFTTPPIPLQDGFIESNYPSLPAELASILASCLSHSQSNRPEMSDVQSALQRHVLMNRHRARIITPSQIYEIDAEKREVRLGLDSAHLHIRYDGQRFLILEWRGSVWLNNMIPIVGNEMPATCVITFHTNQGHARFVTFDVSHPEVAA